MPAWFEVIYEDGAPEVVRYRTPSGKEGSVCVKGVQIVGHSTCAPRYRFSWEADQKGGGRG